jgi:hypothetical protein
VVEAVQLLLALLENQQVLLQVELVQQVQLMEHQLQELVEVVVDQMM